MSFANPLSRLSSIIRAPVMTHTAHSTESDWFFPYDGPIEPPPPPPPTRHPFAAELAHPKPTPAAPARSKPGPKSESRERAGRDDARSRSRSRSRDAKRKSQRSYVALDSGGGIGAYPAPERVRDREKDRSSTHSDYTFGAQSVHTFGAHSGHTRGQGSLGLATVDPQYAFPPTDESVASTGGKSSDPPLVFANHPFRMHTGSSRPRSHTASLITPWVHTITSSPAPPAPAPMRKRTLTYQPGLVSSFGSMAETRVGYRESGAFIDLDAREREKIRPTLLPPSLSLLNKNDTVPDGAGEHGTREGHMHKISSSDSYLGLHGQYDMRSHPYAAAPSGPVRETRFGSVSTTTTTTTGGTGKPPVPPRPAGLKLKSSLKPSASTPELRLRIPASAPVARRTPEREFGISEGGLGVGTGVAVPRSAGAAPSSAAGVGLEVRTLCDALIFARPRFRVAAHEITPPSTPRVDGGDREKERDAARDRDREAAKRASVVVGEGGLRGLACFPRNRSRSEAFGSSKEKERQADAIPGSNQFKTVEEVLQDQAQLEKEREEWSALSQGSLLNNRTRSLSRSQSRIGGARVGGARPRRETGAGAAKTENSGGGSGSGWGTLKLKKSVEMLAATALSQGHGHAPSASVSSLRHRGAQGSVSTSSHVRGASGSVVSRAHSRADSWGQRVLCGSRSASSLGEDAAGAASGHMGQSSEGLLRGTRRGTADDYPVVDIRPAPVGNTNRARAPPPPPPVSSGFGVAGPSTRGQFHTSPSKLQTAGLKPSPVSGYATLHPAQPPPSPGESVIGLALSSPSTSTLVLPNHPFAQRAGAYPAIDLTAGLPTGPETIATRHRHPPRSSGSTERARLDEPGSEIRPSRSAPPPVPSHDLSPLNMRFPPPGPSKSAPPHEHPFVARPVLMGDPSGEVQRMFENAMLKSVVHNAGEFDPRRGSGDSGLGSSVNDHGGVEAAGKAFGMATLPTRGSAFGPPGGFEPVVADAPEVPAIPSGLQPPTYGEASKAASPQSSAQSPYSLLESLSPSSRPGILTRTSSGLIDPALAGAVSSPMLSHVSSSSSFSSPRPLASLDDIESLRDIFYRPSPVPHMSLQLTSNEDGSPSSEREGVLSEEAEDASESESTDEHERDGAEPTERPVLGGGDQEDWTFGRRPFERRRESQLLWSRRHDGQDKTPLRIDLELAPGGAPSPPTASAPMPNTLLSVLSASRSGSRSAPAASHGYRDVPESVHDSDSQSERSVFTTSSQRATNG